MGGLLAARVLSERFERVTILERDVFPTEIATRKGVPQGQHPHGLLSAGYRTLLNLFPDLEAELLKAGGLKVDVTNDGYWFQNGDFLASSPSDLHGVSLSRPNLESIIRQRVLSLANVVVQTDVAVTNLLSQDNQVIGVQYEVNHIEQQLKADLVMDASGRGSQSPKWLEQMGFTAPKISQIKVNMAYSTRTFRRSSSDLNGKALMVIAPKAPRQKRGAVILAQENDQWAVTLIGMHGDHPPTDQAGFLEFTRSLPTPELYDLLKDAEPLSDIVPFKFPASLRRHYEKLRSFPEGFLVLGDAMCSFNPIFGQGMSVSSLEVQALSTALNLGLEGIARRFFNQAAAVIETAWMLAAGADFAFTETIGKRGPEVNLIHAYIAKLLTAARYDPVLTVAFHTVGNMVKPPSSLFAPIIIWRVLRSSSQQKTRKANLVTASQR